MDKADEVANPARGQLNRENEYFPVPVRAREFGLARRVRPSRPSSAVPSLVSLLILPTQATFMYLYTAIRNRVSPEFI